MKQLQDRPLLFVLLLSLTIVGLVLHETGNTQAVENLILRPVTPVQDNLSSLANDFSNMVRLFAMYSDYAAVTKNCKAWPTVC